MIVIIEGCGTNIASIEYAISRLAKSYVLSNDPLTIQNASHVIIPGVSTAKRALDKIDKYQLATSVSRLKCPVLGICSGMQLMFEWCEEGAVDGLGIFAGNVNKLRAHHDLILPHMGWNVISKVKPGCALLAGLGDNEFVYFVHSFAATLSEYTVASCDYGSNFSAVVQNRNFYGTQFHPEKSGKIGLKILNNFLNLGNTYANHSSN